MPIDGSKEVLDLWNGSLKKGAGACRKLPTQRERIRMAKHDVINTFLKRHPDVHRNGLPEALKRVDEQLQPMDEVGDYEAPFIPAATCWDDANKTLQLFFLSDPVGEKSTAIQRFGHELYYCAKCFTEVWVISSDGSTERKWWDVRDEVCWTIQVAPAEAPINQVIIR
jgi:hypothetical protein